MERTISHSIVYSQPPAAVWEYLTQPDLMELWLMKNNFEPKVGHQFQFFSRPIPDFDFDGNIYCTVLELVPHQKLSYSWKGGPGDGRITMDSVVTFTLIPKGKGTELQLEHAGFKILENMFIFNAMNDGWLKNIQKIVDLLNNATNATTHA